MQLNQCTGGHNVMKMAWIDISRALTLLLRDESGQDLIEYSVVAALVGLASIMSVHSLSNKIDTAFTSIGNGLTNAI